MTSLRQAFEETHYIVYQPSLILKIGLTNQPLDAMLQTAGCDCAAFITAWNPMCQALNSSENQSRQQRLIYEIDGAGYKYLKGIGKHPSNNWPGEESILILGISFADAKDLSQRHGQAAFVWHEISGETQLVIT